MGVAGASGSRPPDDGSTASTGARHKAARREQTRQIAALVIGALVAVFAVLNLDKVKVDWIIATTHTPLIVVIVVAFLLGIAADRLLVYRARYRRGKRK